MSNNFLIVPPNCPKCGKQMRVRSRVITCGFHVFLGVTDLVCECGHTIENVFDLKCTSSYTGDMKQHLTYHMHDRVYRHETNGERW